MINDEVALKFLFLTRATYRVMKAILTILSLGFFVVFSNGCGLKPAGSNESVTPQNGRAVSVYVFSAPWCAECNKELPEMKQKYLNELDASQQSVVSVKVFVVTGKTPGQAATQEASDEYGKSLALPFSMLADKNYKTYRKFFEEGNAIPAAVLLDDQQKIIQLYEAGSTNLDDLFAKIKLNIK